MTEENKTEEKPVLDELMETNEKLKEEVNALKEEKARQLLGGKSEKGEEAKEEEISDAEYADRALRNQL